MAKSLFGVKEGGEVVFLARFKSILIRTGGWAGHFVLSCGFSAANTSFRNYDVEKAESDVV